MTDSPVRRGVFVIGLGFCARIYFGAIVVRSPHTRSRRGDAVCAAVSLYWEIFFYNFAPIASGIDPGLVEPDGTQTSLASSWFRARGFDLPSQVTAKLYRTVVRTIRASFVVPETKFTVEINIQ